MASLYFVLLTTVARSQCPDILKRGPVAAFAGIAGSNPAGGMNVCLF